ncbi:MAG: LysR family transcriptional regulator [Acidimicrobiaceae bacterium]|jgi:DNA-binding transcriptional LysR family regulator|nr:LysR family transcriptional regulator [Acidimicrobiaceae bacterium]
MARLVTQKVGRLHRLAVFDAAARLGGFSAAARELGMTQPAVTRQIRALERSLGRDLFTRTANRSELTDAGQSLHSHVAAGLDRIDAGVREFTNDSGAFVLATHPGVAQLWLVPRLESLSAALHPLDVRMWFFERSADIEAGGFDASIRVGDGNFPDHHAELLFRERVVPVCSPAFAAEHGLHAESTPAEICEVPFVNMDDGDTPWMAWADWLAAGGVERHRQPGRVLLPNYPMVVQQALIGRGVALGWRGLIDELVDGGALTVVGPEITSARGYYVVWPKDRRSVETDALVAWLRAEAAS